MTTMANPAKMAPPQSRGEDGHVPARTKDTAKSKDTTPVNADDQAMPRPANNR